MEYDFLIIGSGLGGLTCGAILSKNGFKVCILEQSPKIGGCLQSYVRDGGLFDTGVHYIGSMNKGQTLYQIFDYLGIISQLSLRQLDVDRFDEISFNEDKQRYAYAQGYDRFIDRLSQDFPNNRKDIEQYCRKIQNVCSKFPMYRLAQGDFAEKLAVMELDTYTEISKITTNPKLQNVLAGTNPLYMGMKEQTPFYIHALIINSFIESAWKLTKGGSELAKALSGIIKAAGGEIFTSKKVTRIKETNGKVNCVYTQDSEQFQAKNFISAIHPTETINMVETNLFRPAFYKRFRNFKNTIAPFILNATLKKPIPGLENSNHYHYTSNNVWEYQNVSKEKWPGTLIAFSTHEHKGVHAISTMSCLAYETFAKWEETQKTTYSSNPVRDHQYEDLKAEYTEKMLATMEKMYPGFNASIDKIHTITGLTYRDHTGIPEGSFYGISKDYKNPAQAFILPKTKIPNLFLTGQNLNVHGVYGVVITALMTCSLFLDVNRLLTQIKNVTH